MTEELHLKNYIDVLNRRRDIVVLFFVAMVLAVTIGSFIMNPVYRATVTIFVDPESPNVLTTTGAVELQSQNYYSYREYYQSQTELLASYSLAKKVFDEFELAKQPRYAKAKEPIKKFLKTIKIEPVRDTRILKLNVDNNDPVLASKLANRIAELYVLRNLYYISKTELMNLLKNEYLKLEAKMSEYEKVFKGGHPEMVKLKKEMAEITDRMEQEKKSAYSFDNLEEYVKEGSRHALAGFKANNITIQDFAEVPVTPLKPKKLLNILLAIIFGAFGGVVLAFFLEYLDDTVKSGDDLRSVEWPLIGSIRNITDGGNLPELEKDIFVHVRPNDPISEAYRLIRTNVMLSSTEEHPLRCLVVTSPGPQEGKTTTLCNLAIAMAQNNKKVLLIDADMRKPRLHEAFKLANDAGLSSYLCGQADFDNLIQKTEIPNLFLIKGGPHPPNPSELLGSHRLKDLVAAAKQKFDFILFDSPPVMAVTDAILVSQALDGVIMVVECGKTPKRTLPFIDTLLKNAQARLIGAVANRVPVTTHGHYYYYYGKK